ncbi:MAG: AAC(3) family N-acetyltransferase [Planctomycetota bacterium]
MTEPTPPFSQALIEAGLRRLGLKPGDTVLVHSSLKDLATIKDLKAAPDYGQPWFVQAFRNVLTDDGLLVMPTFTKTFTDEHYGPSGLVWDKTETPSRVGSLTDFTWRLPGAARSDHPTHSVTALGKAAVAFCQGHEYNRCATFGKPGPWGNLWRRNAWICMYGTWFNTCTAVHLAEDWLNLPFMAPTAPVAIKGPTGATLHVNVTQSPWGSRDFYKRKDSKVELRLLRESPDIFTIDAIGKCQVVLVRFRDLLGRVIAYHFDDPCILLNDPAQDGFARQWSEPTIAHMRAQKKDAWREGL